MSGLITVTIGVCAKDCQSTLDDAIRSVIDQDFAHDRVEVIFVDDGSTDRTLSVIERNARRMDMRCRVFSTPWRGLGPARNLVVNNSSGEYIIWVDGDMILPRDHVKKQLEFMAKNPDVGIAKARYGTLPSNNLVGFLENLEFQFVDLKYHGTSNSRVLGTGGSIYRVKAIKEVGGFDDKISGAGEDAEIEQRVRNAGWLLYRATPAVFFERRRTTLKSLWDEYYWLGYGGPPVFRRNSNSIILYKMTPPAGFIAGLWYAIGAYKTIHSKTVFLLPIHHGFKRTAWFFGFVKSQIEEFMSGRKPVRGGM